MAKKSNNKNITPVESSSVVIMGRRISHSHLLRKERKNWMGSEHTNLLNVNNGGVY
jgi:hypothetical protein